MDSKQPSCQLLNFIVCYTWKLVCLFIVFPTFISNAQKNPVKVAVHIGSNLWLQNSDYCYSPKRFEGQIFQWNAVPVDQIKSGSGSSISNRINFSLSASIQKRWNAISIGSLEVGYAQSTYKSSDGSCFRFTDQVLENRGFVVNSNYHVTQIYQSNSYLFFRPKLLMESANLRTVHRFGLGALSYLVTSSAYHLELFNKGVHHYKGKDLRTTDWVWTFVPELSYQVRVKKLKASELFASTSLSARTLHFTQIASQNNYRGGPVLFVGLSLEGVPQKKKK
jgi:hypothetical protein